MHPDRSRHSRRTLLAALGVVGVGALAGCDAVPLSRPSASTATESTPTPSPEPPTPSSAAPRVSASPRGLPERLVVVSAGGATVADAPIRPVTLDKDGVLSPPGGVVGWYHEPGWPRPGYPGAAILAGHVGTPANGPDVFRQLPQARRGDLVTVSYDSGDVVRFVVRRSAGVPKQQTPEDDSIWDAGNPEPLLRLITCDPRTPLDKGHYEGNWVVWADLA